MPDQMTILAPIRYPLTDDSARTLAAAGRLAHDHAPADIRVLHVNLFQNEDNTRTEELTRAISSTLDGVEASVITRRGFLVEEVILEEATQIDADVVVVGVNRQTTWRKRLSRLLGNYPDVGSFLRENLPDDIEIKEVETADATPTAELV
jgi:nucleotide-binding universal stress UspA family protein